MKNSLMIVFGLLCLFAWPKFSYADEGWGHHGAHRYFHYHDHPHYGLQVSAFYPNEYYPVMIGGAKYYYDDGIYYSYAGGQYVVAAPPMGAVVSAIPVDFHLVLINGVTYFTDNGTYYIHGPNGYMVVSPPH